VSPLTASAFDLPGRLAAKADPALIAGDERHFAAIAQSLEQTIAGLSGRLDTERKAPGGIGQQALERDLEIHRMSARLRVLRRFGLDLCLGRIVRADDPEPVYIGRLGLTDSAGQRLLVDWRSPAAEPFFAATHASPAGLASRRRYRWTRGRVSDYWDEVFTPDGLEGQRLGDPQASRRKRRHDAAVAAEREQIARVVDDLIEAAGDDEYGTGLVTMLRGEDFHDALIDKAALPGTDPDRLAGPFAHIVVDEAQELTDAEWQMLLSRCPSRSFTIVGDRAQARHGFTESWRERLERVGLDQISLASLSINYRTPQEVMAEAEPVIRAVLPDANVPVSIRATGIPVGHRSASDLGPVLDTWLAEHADGIAAVIGDPAFRATSRVRSLTPQLSKGLEFDLVILIDPETFGTGIEGAVDRYVAMTRATQQLLVLTSPDASQTPGYWYGTTVSPIRPLLRA